MTRRLALLARLARARLPPVGETQKNDNPGGGGDTCANDYQPISDLKGAAVPCHTEMQTRRGIWNIENLALTQLLQNGVYELLFVWSPLKIFGATGSPGSPVALY